MPSFNRSVERMQKAGFSLTFGKNVSNVHRFNTASVADRLSDFHDAYRDKSVKAVWCMAGGWSANELLPGIDWELVKMSPKPIIGFSDITALVNAVFARTGNIGLLGPNFLSIGRYQLFDYSITNLIAVLCGNQGVLKKSDFWGDGGRPARKTKPWQVLSKGSATGQLVGGNLGTFYLLQGTAYQPKFCGKIILLVEDDDEAGKHSAAEFDRRLESLLQLPGARASICGVLVGRFQPGSKVSMPDLQDIIERKFSNSIPVFANLDFGHTVPQLTFPIGGTIKMSIKNNRSCVELLEY